MQWEFLKDGKWQRIQKNNYNDMRVKGNVYELEMYGVEPDEYGTYRCIANNAEGSCSETVELYGL